jgi:uncharacterized protein (TIGR03086 family)
MDVVERYEQASRVFGAHVLSIGDGDWCAPTPCEEWDVRSLLNHLVGENLWAVELFAGRTIAEVGSRLDGDLLGHDPAAAWAGSAAGALAAIREPGAVERTVHLSFGDFTGAEYLEQLFADLLVHGWDLARSIGRDERLDPALVRACASWFASWEDGYRSAGAIGARPAVDQPDDQARLLAAFGRNPSVDDPLSVIRRFNEALNRHDIEAALALTTDDIVFDSTTPPDGTRYEGKAAVRAIWSELVASTPNARFTVEEGVIRGDRATYRWRYDWGDGHVRGVDLFRTRDGRVAEKLSYVKG